MRQMRALNRQRLDTWQFMRIEAVDRLGRFDSFGVVAQLYADYLAWADRQSDGVWTPIHRRTFDVFVRSHVEVRRGRAIGWALKTPLFAAPTGAIKATTITNENEIGEWKWR